MKITELILFLLGILIKKGNLRIRIFAEGQNFIVQKSFFSVDEWENKIELHIS